MKKARKEIDVDFIGGEGPLTKEEEQLITDFIKSKKQATKRRSAQQGLGKIAAARTQPHR